VLADESLDGGRRIHVRDRHHRIIAEHLPQLCPAFLRLRQVCHVRHAAAGAKVRKQDPHRRRGQNVGALGHEMHATENDELRILLLGRAARQLEAVSDEVGKRHHVVLLIVMPQHDQPTAQRFL
jgi:hypothetical protein